MELIGDLSRGTKYLFFITMLYLTIKLSTVLLIYKVIQIGAISFTASTLIMPFWFFIGTIITETYGYRVARHLIWLSLICQFIFAFICAALIKFHSPEWVNQEAFDLILGRLPRVTIASSLAITCGAFINSYLLAKYKIFWKGKGFWWRGLKSSAIGEFVFTLVAYITEFIGILSFNKIVVLMSVSFLVKISLSPILIIFATIITKKIKKNGGIDTFDYNTNFNPFIFNLDEENNTNKKSNVIYIKTFSDIKNATQDI